MVDEEEIVLLEFKRTTDYSESYYLDMWMVSEQNTPILMHPRTLVTDRGWEVVLEYRNTEKVALCL